MRTHGRSQFARIFRVADHEPNASGNFDSKVLLLHPRRVCFWIEGGRHVIASQLVRTEIGIDRSVRKAVGSSRDVPPRPRTKRRKMNWKNVRDRRSRRLSGGAKICKAPKAQERICIGARRSVHLPVFDKQSELSAIPRRDHVHSQAVTVCEDRPPRRPRAECFRQLRLKSAPAPAYGRSA
ncbi:unnamed protein product [Sphagnum jensenii]|uniref:Uncharacterized protein n=1 Tax=Sphagnum jensenii TaxID=128206 RepID=A0ABP1B0P1_9BRYO